MALLINRLPLGGRAPVALAVVAIAVIGCGSAGVRHARTVVLHTHSTPLAPTLAADHANDVYWADGAGMLSPRVRGVPARVYVPNSLSNTVDVIDQHSFKVVRQFRVGALPQHVTPSYDLSTLYVDNNAGNSLTPIDPRTGRPRGPPIPVADPYNLLHARWTLRDRGR
jgi:YVTN family beta-propeller protein